VAVPGILIILFDSLANLCRGHPDDRVFVGVIVRRSAEDFYPKDTLLKLIGVTGQNVSHDIFEKARIALAGVEQRGSEQRFEFTLNGRPLNFVRRYPADRCLIRWQSYPTPGAESCCILHPLRVTCNSKNPQYSPLIVEKTASLSHCAKRGYALLRLFSLFALLLILKTLAFYYKHCIG